MTTRRSFLGMMTVPVLAPSRLAAETFPSRPVRIVVPFPAGGGTDILIRLIQENYSTKLGQRIVVDNRPGATGNIGSGAVASSAPDGYTLLIQATIIGLYPAIFPKLAYDPFKDFAFVGGLAQSPAVIVVNPESKFRTIGHLMEEAKQRSLNFASAGIGSPQHLAIERLSRLNKVQMTHVPYKGSATAVGDLIVGVLDFGALSLSSVLSFVQAGTLRAIAVAGEERTSLLPDVPTLKETGFGDISGAVRFFLAAPAGTPPAIVDRLNKDLQAVIEAPDIQKGFAERGYEIALANSAQVEAMVREQHETWLPIVRDLKLKFD